MCQLGALVGNGLALLAAALAVADAFCRLGAVCGAGCIVVGDVISQLMTQGGAQQLCGDLCAAAALIGDGRIFEAGCRSAGFQSHACVVFHRSACSLVQQLFGGILPHVRIRRVVGNGAGGQVIGIGDNFAIAIPTTTNVRCHVAARYLYLSISRNSNIGTKSMSGTTANTSTAPAAAGFHIAAADCDV